MRARTGNSMVRMALPGPSGRNHSGVAGVTSAILTPWPNVWPAFPTDLTLTRSPFLAGLAGGCGWHACCRGRVGDEVGHDTHEALGLLPVEQVTCPVEPLQPGVGNQAGQDLG